MTFNKDIFGFDISYYQGAVDFGKIKSYGAKFLILRLGYALTKDIRFDEYMAGAQIPTSVYHFYDPVYDPLKQAQKVIEILAPYKNKIRRVWLDFEFWWAGTYSDPKHWQIYRDAISAAGYKTGVYTRATWWDSRFGNYQVRGDPCWVAQYNTSLTMIPKSWTRAMIWQSGTPAIGIDAGVSSQEIDYNVWNDDYNFTDEWGGVITPPPTGETMRYEVIGINGLNLRPAANTNNTPIRLIPTGSYVWAVPDVTGWLKGSAYQEPGKAKVDAAFFCSALTTLVKESPEPVVPDSIEVKVTKDGVTKTYTITGDVVES